MLRRAIVFTALFAILSYMPGASASLGFVKLFISRTHPNCSHAVVTSNRRFCGSFRLAAQCQCTSAGLPRGSCTDMGVIYKRMLSVFGTVHDACEFQRDTTTQNCLDNWACYFSGGKDSTGQLCSFTGRACTR